MRETRTAWSGVASRLGFVTSALMVLARPVDALHRLVPVAHQILLVTGTLSVLRAGWTWTRRPAPRWTKARLRSMMLIFPGEPHRPHARRLQALRPCRRWVQRRRTSR